MSNLVLSKSIARLKIASALSLGAVAGLLAQGNIKLLMKEPEPEKAVPTIEPKILEEFLNQSKKVNQLENELVNLRRDLREREDKVAQLPPPSPQQKSDVNVFELSQVIEANDLASASRHQRELEEQRKAFLREHLLKLESEVKKVENKYRPVINTIKELELHLEAQKQILEKEAPSRTLWIACQALLDRIRSAPQGPIEEEPAYDVLKRFAANNDSFAISVLDSIPAEALKKGVQSEETLINRFSKVERICKRVDLVGENGGGIAKYLMSYLQSLFIFDNVKVSEDEVSGRQLVDPTSWRTLDILARVKYCLKNHNLEQAVRYANQLRGQARVVARDWIRDARVHLETRQAFSALSAHAGFIISNQI